MGWVLRVFQSRKSSLMLALLKSLVIPLLGYCCQLWNPYGRQRTYTSYRSYSTNVYIQNHWSTALKLLGKTVRTHIVLPPETPWTLYNYIYLEDNTAYCAKYLWHNGAQNKKQIISKTWNTVRYSVSNKQKPSTIPSRKCNNCIWASFVQLVAKISERHRKC